MLRQADPILTVPPPPDFINLRPDTTRFDVPRSRVTRRRRGWFGWITAGVLVFLLAATSTGLIVYRGQASDLRRTQAATQSDLVKTRALLTKTEGDLARTQSDLSLMTTTANQGIRGYRDCQRAAKLSLTADQAFNSWFNAGYFSDYLWQKWVGADRKAKSARENCLVGQVPTLP